MDFSKDSEVIKGRKHPLGKTNSDILLITAATFSPREKHRGRLGEPKALHSLIQQMTFVSLQFLEA